MPVYYTPKNDAFKVLDEQLATFYEDLTVPASTSFVDGEWIGDNNGEAKKGVDANAAAALIRPGMVLAGTDHNDVSESGVVTVIRGKTRIITTIFKTDDTFQNGTQLVISSVDGKGVIGAIPTPGVTGTYDYTVVGEAMGAASGGELKIMQYADPITVEIVVA